jgi:uncharacterized protein YciI
MTEPAASPIEPIWFVEATYAPDAAETRVPFRAEHLARLRELKRQGIVIEGGAFADVSASVLLVRATDEQATIGALWLLGQCSIFVRNREQLARAPLGLRVDAMFVEELGETIARWAARGLVEATG